MVCVLRQGSLSFAARLTKPEKRLFSRCNGQQGIRGMQSHHIPALSNTTFRQHTTPHSAFSFLACTWSLLCAARAWPSWPCWSLSAWHLPHPAPKCCQTLCLTASPQSDLPPSIGIFVVCGRIPLPWLSRYRFTEPLTSTSTRKTSASALPCTRRVLTSLICISDPPTVHRVNVISIDALHTNYVHGSVKGHQDTVYHIDRIVCLACWG